MHAIYFISRKKEKVSIKFMYFSQKYMGSVFFGHPVYIYIYICVCVCVCVCACVCVYFNYNPLKLKMKYINQS